MIVTDAGWDAVDAARVGRVKAIAGWVVRPMSGCGAQDERRMRGRQSRVVLAPVAGVKLAEVREPDRVSTIL
jgi:hypothetical protein